MKWKIVLVVVLGLCLLAGIFKMPMQTLLSGGDLEKEMVIVIDAGHGGIDGGASAADGTLEKDLNLAIAKALEKELQKYPVRVIMTRTDDRGLYSEEGTIRSKKREDLVARKAIMDEENVDLAVSIHMNNFPDDESVFGAQVFYSAQKNRRTNSFFREHTAASYAEKVQESLEFNISDGRERVAMEKNDILIFEEPTCPIILIECGFLSNKNELERLKTAEYQGLLAKAIWEGINANLCLKKSQKIEVIDSANKK